MRILFLRDIIVAYIVSYNPSRPAGQHYALTAVLITNSKVAQHWYKSDGRPPRDSPRPLVAVPVCACGRAGALAREQRKHQHQTWLVEVEPAQEQQHDQEQAEAPAPSSEVPHPFQNDDLDERLAL